MQSLIWCEVRALDQELPPALLHQVLLLAHLQLEAQDHMLMIAQSSLAGVDHRRVDEGTYQMKAQGLESQLR